MADRNGILAKKTHKDDGLEVEQRVYYTLSGEQEDKSREAGQVHRTMKAVALLVKKLRENGTLSENQLDEFLFEVVM